MTTSTAAARVLTTGVLDVDSALTLLEQVVNEKGEDYKVENCVYFDIAGADIEFGEPTGDPVCIVGHVLDKLGKNLTDLRDMEVPDRSTDGINGTDFSSIGIDGIRVPDDARNLLYEAQMQQDGNRTSNRTWGYALKHARFEHEHRNARALLAA